MTKEIYDQICELLDKGLHALANYQYVMLKHILLHGYSSKLEIQKSLARANNTNDYKKYRNCPVFKVLVNKPLGNAVKCDRFQEGKEYFYDLAECKNLTTAEKNLLIIKVQGAKKGYDQK